MAPQCRAKQPPGPAGLAGVARDLPEAAQNHAHATRVTGLAHYLQRRPEQQPGPAEVTAVPGNLAEHVVGLSLAEQVSSLRSLGELVLEVMLSLVVGAHGDRRFTEETMGYRQAMVVAPRATELYTMAGQLRGSWVIAPEAGQRAGRQDGGSPDGGITRATLNVVGSQQPIELQDALGEGTALLPERAERGRQPKSVGQALMIRPDVRPVRPGLAIGEIQGGAEVWISLLQLIQQFRLPGPVQPRAGGERQGQEIGQMPALDQVQLPGLSEAFVRVLPHDLQHPETGRRPGNDLHRL